MTRTIRSTTENSHFLQLQALKSNRTKRHRHGLFLVEGVRPIEQALTHGWQVQSFIFEIGARLSTWAQELLKNSAAETHFELSARLMQMLSDKEETSEVLAVFKIPNISINDVELLQASITVVFDRPGSPGNLGSSLRTCDAFGVSTVILTGHCVDPYDPVVVRSSRGSLFTLPVLTLPSHKELEPWLAHARKDIEDLQIVGASEDANLPIFRHDFMRTTVIVMGNETSGLSDAYKALCDVQVAIPMTGSASSLNVSCATTVFLYEVMRQRTNPG